MTNVAPPSNLIRFKQAVDSRPILRFPVSFQSQFNQLAVAEMQFRENYGSEPFYYVSSEGISPKLIIDKPQRTIQLNIEGEISSLWYFEDQDEKEIIKFYSSLLLRDDNGEDLKPYSGTKFNFQMRNSFTKGLMLS